ncbi:FixJ family two-component response regulator [Bradyrhizobium huanghuaihaiense]|uniref:Response regulator receiver domain-containing protein n=1 Tax=Bradyrhizobium huanghuaihaiense TaxID=990078 RepID=A0A562QBA6_9BRAD|nr:MULTISPECIES: response regulator [Bradyrhizobium]APO50332.1 two-component system response regulator [Bradyrhizobium diazoefficiens]KOY04519.1 chemotaxis protein CheY [Bradyrhizobium diazoefficiens]MCD9299002.1 response regulator [Bradyrhizobium diazoefficiens]MCD9815900.1 response regulator [Bradyrhizobium diazoefficiens]MCD9834139.1 response regulator [Bradyrhizobium diazoefficiens]
MSTPLISVVDDDPSVRAATENLLKSRGYVVQIFASAEALLRSPRLNEISCVITDVQMAAMSGLELLAEMRTRGYQAPFIFITAFPNERVRASALDAGAIGFLAKPFGVQELVKCLDSALQAYGDRGRI